jgi:hypothetical protein
MRPSHLFRFARALAIVAVGIGLIATSGGAAAFGSKPPVLMVLDYYESSAHRQVKVDLVLGETVSPAANKPQEKWWLFPGQAIRVEQRPPDMTAELYKGKGTSHVLLCAIAIRYFRDSSGLWVPHYLLVEQALMVPLNGRLVPITQLEGTTGLIALTGTSLPNADGYYPSLEFGLAQGFMQIDSWVIKLATAPG